MTQDNPEKSEGKWEKTPWVLLWKEVRDDGKFIEYTEEYRWPNRSRMWKVTSKQKNMDGSWSISTSLTHIPND